MPARPRKRGAAGPGVVRLVEATGDSRRSWDAAVAAAVRSAKIEDPIGVEVGRLWAELDGGKLTRFHATVKVAYRQSQRTSARRTT